MSTKTYLFLVEGVDDEVFYEKLIVKLVNARVCELDELPDTIGNLLKRRRDVRLFRVDSVFIAIVNCGGYDNVKRYLRELLKYEELIECIRQGLSNIIVSADKDKKPLESIPGVVDSVKPEIGFRVVRNKDYLEIILQDSITLTINLVEQGIDHGVKALEDHIEEVAKQVESTIAKAIDEVEKVLGRKLNSKQRVGVYEAIIVSNKGVPSLISYIIDKTREDELEKKLSKQIRVVKAIVEK